MYIEIYFIVSVIHVRNSNIIRQVEIWQDLNMEKLRQDLQTLLDKGIRSLAVVLMHAYTFTKHETAVGKLAKDMGFDHVSLSHETMPMVRIVPRGYTGTQMILLFVRFNVSSLYAVISERDR